MFDDAGQAPDGRQIPVGGFEAAHAFSEHALFALFDDMDVGVLACRPDGQLVHANPAAVEKLGCSSPSECFGPIENLAGLFEFTTREGQAVPFAQWPLARALSGETVRRIEFGVRRLDRDWSRRQRFSSALMHDRRGEPSLVVMTIRDISEQDRLQEQLRQRIEELETVMEMAPVALFVSDDPRCDHMVGNRLATALYDAAPEDNLSANREVGEAHPERRFYSDDRELAADELPMQVAAATNAPVCNSELEVRLRSGHRFDILCSATPLHDVDGAVRGCVGAFLDISGRKRIERELKSALAAAERQKAELQTSHEELEAFNHSVAHDLKGPLRSINSLVHVLQEDCGQELNTECRASFEMIRKGALRMSELLDGLLRLSRISRMEMVSETVSLTALAHELADQLRVAEPGRTVEIEIAADLFAEGDEAALRLLLQNLLGNAWKYTAGRSPARVRFRRDRHEGREVFVVEDNGAGFDAAHADRLFRPFERLHDRSEFPGTGIGLSTVQRIVRRHGGEVWGEGRPGEGAAFFFTLGE